jgi:hypothetical protein
MNAAEVPPDATLLPYELRIALHLAWAMAAFRSRLAQPFQVVAGRMLFFQTMSGRLHYYPGEVLMHARAPLRRYGNQPSIGR